MSKSRILVALWAVLACLALVRVQAWCDEEPATGVKLETAQIRVLDEFGRPYQVPTETAWLGVRLAQGDNQNPTLKGLKTMATEGLEYDVESDEWGNYFPITDGTAEAKFVVFEDAARNPVNYELGLFERTPSNGKKLVATFKNLWQAGQGAQTGVMKAGVRRPELTPEKLAIWGFIIGMGAIAYGLFGIRLFRRMLFNKRLDVGSAITWSNILVLIFFLLAVIVATLMYLYPRVLWGNLANVYYLSFAGYLVVLFVTYGIGSALTRR